MGLSSMPSPSEGILTLLLFNTAIYVSILRETFRSVLQLLRLRTPQLPQPPPPPPQQQQQPLLDITAALVEPTTVTECFRSQFKPVPYGSVGARSRTGSADRVADCRVCLNQFEPESVVNRLPCGHLFHRACLETWLDYSHATCPLCRTHILYGDGGGETPTY